MIFDTTGLLLNKTIIDEADVQLSSIHTKQVP